MAVIPRATPAGTVPRAPGGVRAPQVDVSSALQGASSTLEALSENMVSQRRSNTLAQKKIEIYKRLGNLESEVNQGQFKSSPDLGFARTDEPGGDFSEAPEAFTELSKGVREEITGDISDPVVRQQIEQAFDLTQAQHMAVVRNNAVKRMRDQTIAELDINTIELRKQFAAAPTQRARDLILGIYAEQLESAETSLAITAEESQARVQQFRQQAAFETANRALLDAEGDPTATANVIKGLKNDPLYSHLLPEDRIKLDAAAETAHESAKIESTENSVATLINAGSYDTADQFVRDTDMVDAERKRILFGRIRTARTAANAGRRTSLNAEARDHLASLRTTGQGMPGFRERLTQVATPEELAQFNEAEILAFTAYDFRKSVEFASPGEMKRELDILKPLSGEADFADKQALYGQALEQVNAIRDARAQDPAGYAAQHPEAQRFLEAADTDDPQQARSYLQVLQGIQEGMGIPKVNRRVLPQAQAIELANSFNGAPAGTKPDQMRSLQEAYGEQFPAVMQELVEEGLEPGNKFLPLVMHNEGMSRIVAEAAAADRTELVKGVDADDVSTIRTTLRTELADLETAMMRTDFTGGAIEDINILEELAEKVALIRFRRGATAEDAAAFAVKGIVDDNLEVLEFNDTMMYVPRHINGKIIDMAGVENTAQRMQLPAQLEAFDLAPMMEFTGLEDEELQKQLINSASALGIWITNESGDGAFLAVPTTDGAIVPLENADGDRYEFMFTETEGVLPLDPALRVPVEPQP